MVLFYSFFKHTQYNILIPNLCSNSQLPRITAINFSVVASNSPLCCSLMFLRIDRATSKFSYGTLAFPSRFLTNKESLSRGLFCKNSLPAPVLEHSSTHGSRQSIDNECTSLSGVHSALDKDRHGCCDHDSLCGTTTNSIR